MRWEFLLHSVAGRCYNGKAEESMDTTKATKLPYNTPQFERYGNVRDLTMTVGHNVASGPDAGTNTKTLAQFVRTH